MRLDLFVEEVVAADPNVHQPVAAAQAFGRSSKFFLALLLLRHGGCPAHVVVGRVAAFVALWLVGQVGQVLFAL
jgi:hypothetical protein